MKKLLLGILILFSFAAITAAEQPTLKELTLQHVLTNFTAEHITPYINRFNYIAASSKVLKRMQMAAILHADVAKRDLSHPENLGAEKVALLRSNGLWNIEISIQDLLDNPATRHLLTLANEYGKVVIILRNLFITSLNGLNAVPGIDRVEWLSLSENQLTTLSVGAFANMPQLQRLSLANNKLTELTPGAFASLPQLQRLYLYNNQLTTVAADTFAQLPHLENLYLHKNPLTEENKEAIRRILPAGSNVQF